jgi:hypothetical protein
MKSLEAANDSIWGAVSSADVTVLGWVRFLIAHPRIDFKEAELSSSHDVNRWSSHPHIDDKRVEFSFSHDVNKGGVLTLTLTIRGWSLAFHMTLLDGVLTLTLTLR